MRTDEPDMSTFQVTLSKMKNSGSGPKYAVSPSRDGASISVHAAATNGHLRIDVVDDGPGFDGSTVPAGHGLALARERLAMTFGDRASLGIDSKAGRTAVTLHIPC